MNVVSLFGGMECGRASLKDCGISVDKYYYSEIDKQASKLVSINWPEIIHVGDVSHWKEWDIDWASIDLLIGGSPCQGFSSLGMRAAFDDPRSKLFFVYADILNHIKSVNPKIKFMLENVRMKEDYLDVISNHLGVEPKFINSSCISPCQRPRFYWSSSVIPEPACKEIDYDSCIIDLTETSPGWSKWWKKNGDRQLKKRYSRIVHKGMKGITMTARQYASWNGNFIERDGVIYKPGKKTLANLVGVSDGYFDSCSQRQAEKMSGNGWDVRTIKFIFKNMFSTTGQTTNR